MAPCYTAKWLKQFLEAKNIEIMKYPAQSPDLNLTENLWKILGDKVMAKKPTTVTKLWKRLRVYYVDRAYYVFNVKCRPLYLI